MGSQADPDSLGQMRKHHRHQHPPAKLARHVKLHKTDLPAKQDRQDRQDQPDPQDHRRVDVRLVLLDLLRHLPRLLLLFMEVLHLPVAIENDEFLKPQLDSNEELQLSAASNTKLVMAPALQSVVGHQLAKLEEETAKDHQDRLAPQVNQGTQDHQERPDHQVLRASLQKVPHKLVPQAQLDQLDPPDRTAVPDNQAPMDIPAIQGPQEIQDHQEVPANPEDQDKLEQLGQMVERVLATIARLHELPLAIRRRKLLKETPIFIQQKDDLFFSIFIVLCTIQPRIWTPFFMK